MTPPRVTDAPIARIDPMTIQIIRTKPKPMLGEAYRGGAVAENKISGVIVDRSVIAYDAVMKHRCLLRRALAVMMVAIAFAACADVAMACSCGAIGAPEKEFKDSSLVFVGRVVSIEQSSTRPAFVQWILDLLSISRPLPTKRDREVEFEAHQAWKGVKTADVTLSTSFGYCGIDFKAGEDYLVYATGSAMLVTSQCLRTRPIAAAAEDFAYLGTLPGIKVAPGAGSKGRPSELPYIAGGALLVLILGAEWAFRRRFRKGLS